MTNKSALERSEFKPQYHERTDNSYAQVVRDLRRLRNLIKQSHNPGLNSIESSEKRALIDEYDMKHVEAFNLEFVKD